MPRVLPKGEFDGQVFIDARGMEWRYDASVNCWRNKGLTDTIPVADGTNQGLLSRQLKFLMDRVPDKGGGFAIITKPLLKNRSQDNPDGVLFGDIELISDSLDIRCVHSDGREIENGCLRVAFKETDQLPPGFDINFSDNLLENLCVVVPGGPGLPGERGLKGEDGIDGTGDGPVGLTGDAGEDATEPRSIDGVEVVDLDTVSDVAVTKMDLDAPGGRFFVTKGQVKVPDEDDAVANRLIVSQINRGIRFLEDCFDYELVMLPCRPGDDFDTLDPVIAYLPSHYDPSDIRPVQPVRRRLSDLVNDIVAHYQDKLDKIRQQYDSEIEAFIKDKDREARMILDQLGDRLAECENITYLDYCIGLGDQCVETESAAAIVDIPAQNTECQAIAEAAGKPNAECQIVNPNKRLEGGLNGVFSFLAPASFQFGNQLSGPDERDWEMICPEGCWIQKGSAMSFVGPGGRVLPGWRVIPPPDSPNSPKPPVVSAPVGDDAGVGGADPDRAMVVDLAKRLRAGRIVWPLQQFEYGSGQTEFPPGTYVFLYEGGAFTQDRLNRAEAQSENRDRLIQGPFQEYWVGNEGNGSIPGPLYVLDPNNEDLKSPTITSPVVNTEIGLEIGFVFASNFKDAIPDDFFDVHKYEARNEIGNNSVDLPNPRNDFDGVGIVGTDVQSDERAIQWKKFPTIDANHSDAQAVQQAYLDGPLTGRMVTFTTSAPGFFFARVKRAMSALNFFGALIMPPTTTQFGREVSLNKPIVHLVTPRDVGGLKTPLPTLNAKPIISGEVRLQVVRLVEQEQTPSTTNTTPDIEQQL